MPLVGVRSFNLPGISKADYIELVDFTGQELHPGKRGKIYASERTQRADQIGVV